MRDHRDMDVSPYSADERRVAEWINEKTGIGGGEDPIGFLLGSYDLMSARHRKMIEVLRGAEAMKLQAAASIAGQNWFGPDLTEGERECIELAVMYVAAKFKEAVMEDA